MRKDRCQTHVRATCVQFLTTGLVVSQTDAGHSAFTPHEKRTRDTKKTLVWITALLRSSITLASLRMLAS